VVAVSQQPSCCALAEETQSLDRVAYWVVDYFSAAAIHQRPRQMQHKMRNAPSNSRREFGPHSSRSAAGKVQELRYFAEKPIGGNGP